MTAEWRAEQGERPRIFHAYDWGGYLTWHGWPDILTWIDDRNEVQGKERIERYFAIIAAEPGWERWLADIDWVCIDPEDAAGGEAARPTRDGGCGTRTPTRSSSSG